MIKLTLSLIFEILEKNKHDCCESGEGGGWYRILAQEI